MLFDNERPPSQKKNSQLLQIEQLCLFSLILNKSRNSCVLATLSIFTVRNKPTLVLNYFSYLQIKYFIYVCM